MSDGCLLFAFNNEKIDYIKQAKELAFRIRKYFDLPTTLVTDVEVESELFEQVIKFDKPTYATYRTYHNVKSNYKLQFKNTARIFSFDLSPYEKTLVLDTDIVLCNSIMKSVFQSQADVMMYSNAMDVGGYRDTNEFRWISDTGCKFYWATCLFFQKNKTTKIFFNLVQHIYENWGYYRTLYQINDSVYRNDFAFSIASHIMNDHSTGDFVQEMPGVLKYSIDKDIIEKINDDEILFLIEHPSNANKYFPVKTKTDTVHCMNKFDLDRLL